MRITSWSIFSSIDRGDDIAIPKTLRKAIPVVFLARVWF
jgi:hypothetical protein